MNHRFWLAPGRHHQIPGNAFRDGSAAKPTHYAISAVGFDLFFPKWGFPNAVLGVGSRHGKGVSPVIAINSASGMTLAARTDMTVAVPISQERISPLLDAAARLLLVSCRCGNVVSRREIVLGPLSLDSLTKTVAELGVDWLLCAALSEPLRRDLERHGVRIHRHLCGPVEEVLQAFCRGQLDREAFRMPGCWCHHGVGNEPESSSRHRLA